MSFCKHFLIGVVVILGNVADGEACPFWKNVTQWFSKGKSLQEQLQYALTQDGIYPTKIDAIIKGIETGHISAFMPYYPGILTTFYEVLTKRYDFSNVFYRAMVQEPHSFFRKMMEALTSAVLARADPTHQDLYRRLGIPQNAPHGLIRWAYSALVASAPDKAEQHMMQGAYQALIDPKTREGYHKNFSPLSQILAKLQSGSDVDRARSAIALYLLVEDHAFSDRQMTDILFPYVRKALADSHWIVRLCAVQILGLFGSYGAWARSELLTLRLDSDYGVAIAAKDLLEKLKGVEISPYVAIGYASIEAKRHWEGNRSYFTFGSHVSSLIEKLMLQPRMIAPTVSLDTVKHYSLDNPAHLETLAQMHDTNPHMQDLLINHRDDPFVQRLRSLLYRDLRMELPFARYDSNGDGILLRMILAQAGAIQLENICKVGCTFCGFTHNPAGPWRELQQIYRQFDVATLRSLFFELGTRSNVFMLYYQSDPFDYEMALFSGGTTTYHYADIHRMYQIMLQRHTDFAISQQVPNLAAKPLFVSTFVPKGAEDQVLAAIDQGMVHRVSISYLNSKRLETSQEKGSFLEKAERIRETRQELQGEFRHGPLMVIPDWLAQEIAKAKALQAQLGFPVVGGKPNLQGVRLTPIGQGFGDAKYTGTTVESERYPGELMASGAPFTGIGCFKGVLITPQGLYNVVQLPYLNAKYPDGQLVFPISTRFSHASLPEGSVTLETVLSQGIVQFVSTNKPGRQGSDTDFQIQNPATLEIATYTLDPTTPGIATKVAAL